MHIAISVINSLPYLTEGAVSIGLIVIISSVIEWILHARILHGKPGTDSFGGHQEHHDTHQKKDYKNIHSGSSYSLPFSFLVYCSLSNIVIAVCISLLLMPHPFIMMTLSVPVAISYFLLIGFVHRRVHQPKKDGWFEKTRLYRYLDRTHHTHHAREDRNFCILTPFLADRIFGTSNGKPQTIK